MGTTTLVIKIYLSFVNIDFNYIGLFIPLILEYYGFNICTS